MPTKYAQAENKLKTVLTPCVVLREWGMAKSNSVTGAGILSRFIMWQACTGRFIMHDQLNRNDAFSSTYAITPAEAMHHWANSTAQFGENAEKQVIKISADSNYLSEPRPMMDDSGDFKSREQNAGVEHEDRGIGNWNRHCISRMSRNPNTRRNSSRT